MVQLLPLPNVYHFQTQTAQPGVQILFNIPRPLAREESNCEKASVPVCAHPSRDNLYVHSLRQHCAPRNERAGDLSYLQKSHDHGVLYGVDFHAFIHFRS